MTQLQVAQYNCCLVNYNLMGADPAYRVKQITHGHPPAQASAAAQGASASLGLTHGAPLLDCSGAQQDSPGCQKASNSLLSTVLG